MILCQINNTHYRDVIGLYQKIFKAELRDTQSAVQHGMLLEGERIICPVVNAMPIFIRACNLWLPAITINFTLQPFAIPDLLARAKESRSPLVMTLSRIRFMLDAYIFYANMTDEEFLACLKNMNPTA